MPDTPPSSLYIHIPFCVRKCAYCDFLSFPLGGGGDTSSREEVSSYVEALISEIRRMTSWYPDAFSGAKREAQSGKDAGSGEGNKAATFPLKTVYFGGGTPSLLSPGQFRSILQAMKETFGIAEDCEITLEANPGTIDEKKLSAFAKAGANRLSLGIQSLDDAVLTTLGRIHDAETAKRAVRDAKRAGFTNLSCDLMLGIPGQTLESIKETVGFLLEEKIPHVSLYSLILEEGTPMYARYGGDIEKYVTQEQDREMYHLVKEILGRYGYVHYEISNMALPGYESRHNMMYWRAENYFACGVGAHYYLGNERGCHVGTVKEYVEAMRREDVRKEDVLSVEETLTEEEKMREFMMLSFRTRNGVSERAFLERFGKSLGSVWGEELVKEQAAGLVVHVSGAYRLTEKGVDLANQVFMDYV